MLEIGAVQVRGHGQGRDHPQAEFEGNLGGQLVAALRERGQQDQRQVRITRLQVPKERTDLRLQGGNLRNAQIAVPGDSDHQARGSTRAVEFEHHDLAPLVGPEPGVGLAIH